MDISVVIPLFNEEKNLSDLYKRIKKTLDKIGGNHEIIFVDDGSKDNSLFLLKNLHKNDKKIKVISFTRNFGHMPAISAGIKLAKGKKVVVIDADLQDPPEIISDMWKKSKDGYDIVYGVKTKRKENFVKRFLFSSFYKVLNKISKIEMPPDAGTFSLLDRKVIDQIIALSERNKYFSGLRVWTGFSQIGVIYERDIRKAGKAKNISKLFSMALDGLLAFSYLPLRLASALGFLFAFIAFIFIAIVLIARLIFDKGIVGWASTMSTILFIGGIQLITLGIIGEYLGRIYDEVKSRPEYIISETIGLKNK